MTTIAEIIPSLLNSLVDRRVYRSATPDNLVRDGAGIADFIVYTAPGGTDTEYVDQTAPEMSSSRIQVHALSADPIRVELLIKSVRDTLLASPYTVGVYGSPLDTYDDARKLYGRMQHFSLKYKP